MTAEELLKAIDVMIADFKKESGDTKTEEAITKIVSGLMVYCSQNDLEFEDICDAADRRFDDLEAELEDEGGEDEGGEDDEDEDDEEVEDEDEDDEEDEDLEDGDNAPDDDEAFDDDDEDEDLEEEIEEEEED